MPVIAAGTERLTLRPLAAEDAPFVLALLNDPSFVQFVGDKGVHTLDDAREYISTGGRDAYARRTLYVAARKEDGAPIGICSLVKREGLDEVDLGFAILSEFRGRGYATEAAAWTLACARELHGLRRLVAITTPDNDPSARVLEKLGFRFARMVRLRAGDRELKLFESEAM
jgi:[ribosomal protein S5]-alanine N-acetyltransferase